jgi:exosome complex RNA-binding protein Rrp42 (RNase PH superfamily)
MNQEQDHEAIADSAGESVLTKQQRFLVTLRTKGKLVSDLVLDGFAPVAAVAALIVAVMAFNGNQSSHAQAAKVLAQMEILKANLLANKNELAKLGAELTLQLNNAEERNKKLDVQKQQIIQSVSTLQKKMKISPTLEESMPVTINTVAVQPLNNLVATAKVTPAAPAPVKAMAGAEHVTKPADRIEVLKDAINKFNKK